MFQYGNAPLKGYTNKSRISQWQYIGLGLDLPHGVLRDPSVQRFGSKM